MEVFPGEYWLVRFVFQRGLAIIYLLAFLVAANQFRPLAGEDGLLPIEEYVAGTSTWERPSLFYFYPSDRVVGIAAWTGVVLSVFLVVAGPYWLPDAYALIVSMGVWAVLWVLYQSFVNAGRVFYGYGWESMLLETGFLAIFLGAGSSQPPVVVIWLVKWVLFRNMFGAGLIKLRGDECWRTLRCLDYHYETQPMPNPLSWFAHHLPDRFHRVEVLGNHVLELAVPFLLFAPQPYASVGGAGIIGFQAWLMVTGNFSWLNALTIVQAVAAFNDPILEVLVPVGVPTTTATPVPLTVLAGVVAVVVVVLSVWPVANMISRSQVMNTSFDPLHLVNTYGAFGSVTTDRYQLVLEGTTADDPAEDDWEAYEFKGQPGDPSKRPPQWAPYHLRLDWQLWFAAMQPQPGRRQRWVHRFLEAVLTHDEATLGLVASVPFPESGPDRVRVLRYRYRYSTPAERAATGDWWVRERVGTYVAPVGLEDLRRSGGRVGGRR